MSLFSAPEEYTSVYIDRNEHPDCCGLDLMFGFPSGFSKTKDYRDWLSVRKIVRQELSNQDWEFPNFFVILNHHQFNNFGDILLKEYKFKLMHKGYNKNSGNDLYFMVKGQRKKRVKREANLRLGGGWTGA